jgi:hypothetical protein
MDVVTCCNKCHNPIVGEPTRLEVATGPLRRYWAAWTLCPRCSWLFWFWARRPPGAGPQDHVRQGVSPNRT